MNKLIITAMLLIVSAVAFGQTKTESKKQPVKPAPKQQYEYFVKVPAGTFYQLINAIHDYRDILIYSPMIKTADEKINNQAAIDRALIPLKELRIDSVLKK